MSSVITPQELRKLFCWNPDTGTIWWRSRYKQRQAFVSVQTRGYLYGKVLGKNYLAHRVLWALEFGYWPKEEIDHIDGDRQNNQLSNLREVSRQVNTMNQSRSSNNTSGVTGVSRQANGRWRAFITVRWQHKHLGVFDTFEEAMRARKTAEIQAGFHPNHGKSRVVSGKRCATISTAEPEEESNDLRH